MRQIFFRFLIWASPILTVAAVILHDHWISWVLITLAVFSLGITLIMNKRHRSIRDC